MKKIVVNALCRGRTMIVIVRYYPVNVMINVGSVEEELLTVPRMKVAFNKQ